MSSSALRKFSEDPKLRPFLSTHFDSQAYIKAVIKEGRSEECFNDISNHACEVNEEIKGYISAHKDNLMSGMSDVAVLAERYSNLSSTAQQLRRCVDRLRKNALNSHELVRLKTTELERIHGSSLMLRQLRQFVHAKAQLDHHLKCNNEMNLQSFTKEMMSQKYNFDVRQMATAAKLTNELEGLIEIPTLMGLKIVSDDSAKIREFGQEIRAQTQERLLVCLTERGQASIAACLQIFYNLQSLPEIIMLAIDVTVRASITLARGALNLDSIVSQFPDLNLPIITGGGANNKANSGALLSSSSSTSVSQLSMSGTGQTSSNNKTLAWQQKNALKELSLQWSTVIHDQSMQIHVLQKVIAKKEDPTTHKRFSDILKSVTGPGTQWSTSAWHELLSGNKLVDIYWARLAVALQDLAADLIKSHSNVVVRLYPHLRKATSQTTANIQMLCSSEGGEESVGTGLGSSLGTGTSIGAGLGSGSGSDDMFGSMGWSQSDFICSLGLSSSSSRGRAGAGGIDKINTMSTSQSLSSSLSSSSSSVSASASSMTADTGLVAGLKPIQDRYLIGALARMNYPVLQMFPEVEGYTAAIPSKRDLQMLVTAIQSELVEAASDSDPALLKFICREGVKAVHLLTSKVENMIVHTADVRKLTTGSGSGSGTAGSGAVTAGAADKSAPATAMTRNHAQEDNAQLVVLLCQLLEALDKLPAAVLKTAHDCAGSSLAVLGPEQHHHNHHQQYDSEGDKSRQQQQSVVEGARRDMTTGLQAGAARVLDLLNKQLLSPIVDMLASHARLTLLAMPRDGIAAQADSLDCSRAVQALQRQLPEAVTVHLLQLPRTSVCVQQAIAAVCLSVMSAYVSAAALVRPVTEQSRLRMAQDMSVLEDLIVGMTALQQFQNHSVVLEFRAFRRFLFYDETSKVSPTETSSVLSSSQILSLPYIHHLRPSTVMNHLICASPAQLSLPHEVTGSTLATYFENLTKNLPEDHSINWRHLACEVSSWQLTKASLELFLQRINVLEGAQKALLMSWYQCISSLGAHYYTSQ